MSIPTLIAMHGQPTTRTRAGRGAYNGPVWVPGEDDVATITASRPQPLAGRTLMDLPEGVRVKARYQIYTTADVREDDVLSVYGDALRVVMVEPWPSYRRVIVGGKADDGQ